jgi:hypothetical protein
MTDHFSLRKETGAGDVRLTGALPGTAATRRDD